MKLQSRISQIANTKIGKSLTALEERFNFNLKHKCQIQLALFLNLNL